MICARELIMAILCSVALSGCGGGGNTGSDPSPGKSAFHSFLYGNVAATAEYLSWEDARADRNAKELFSLAGLETSGFDLRLISVAYLNNNLPQHAVHVTKTGNKKLLVYNHGHDGLPLGAHMFARDFLRQAMAAGFDVLFASLPGVGFNRIESTQSYWIKTFGHSEPVVLDPAISTTWPFTHGIYELIDDKDSFMHFFTDQMVILPSLMKLGPQSGSVGISPFVSKANGFPSAQYENISLVGLSGGGTTGLSACAVYPFDKCILIAGFFPAYLRAQNIISFGDAEQISRSIYSVFSVEEMMAAASLQTRRMVYIYNAGDDCCFADPQASQFRVDFPEYDIRVTALGFHGYVAEDIMQELQKP